MGKRGNVSWQLKLKGFGPFDHQLNWTMSANSSKVAIYAGNGRGKTTISRLFRLAENPQTPIPPTLITKGAGKGTFSFNVKSEASDLGMLGIDSSSGIENNLNYLFHVFNSDYVRENLQEQSYSPSSDIEGFIVGKDNIDLSIERKRLEEITMKGSEAKKRLEAVIEERKKELADLCANSVKEYRELNVSSLISSKVEDNCYYEKAAQLKSISRLPDDISAPDRLHFDYSDFDFNRLSSMLTHSYSKANFAESFLEMVRKNAEFIKAGIAIQDGVSCPFCGRRYDAESLSLIDQYDSYLDDQEAHVIAELKEIERQLYQLTAHYANYETRALHTIRIFDELKNNFESLAEKELPLFEPADKLADIVNIIQAEIEEKTADITSIRPASALKQLSDLLITNQANITEANNLIDSLATSLEKKKSQKTKLKKAACTELGKLIRKEQDIAFKEIEDLRAEYRKRHEELLSKEKCVMRPKKDAIARLMTELLEHVFGERYIFDSDTFSIRFRGETLGKSADSILSDGEKSTLAFCFYVASTWELISNDADIDKLFFIIDDPISSMDFNYVYNVMQIIKGLKDRFGLKRLRLLLLTHNVAFFNMIMGNKIFREAWMLDETTMTKVEKELLSPYAAHLCDVCRVANGEMPKHTTGNSIRQILETMMNFENPSLSNLNEYLSSNDSGKLKEVGSLYIICNDQSHGSRTFGNAQPALDASSMRRACKAVIEHVNERYPGQLKATGVELVAGGSS